MPNEALGSVSQVHRCESVFKVCLRNPLRSHRELRSLLIGSGERNLPRPGWVRTQATTADFEAASGFPCEQYGPSSCQGRGGTEGEPRGLGHKHLSGCPRAPRRAPAAPSVRKTTRLPRARGTSCAFPRQTLAALRRAETAQLGAGGQSRAGRAGHPSAAARLLGGSGRAGGDEAGPGSRCNLPAISKQLRVPNHPDRTNQPARPHTGSESRAQTSASASGRRQ